MFFWKACQCKRASSLSTGTLILRPEARRWALATRASSQPGLLWSGPPSKCATTAPSSQWRCPARGARHVGGRDILSRRAAQPRTSRSAWREAGHFRWPTRWDTIALVDDIGANQAIGEGWRRVHATAGNVVLKQSRRCTPWRQMGPTEGI